MCIWFYLDMFHSSASVSVTILVTLVCLFACIGDADIYSNSLMDLSWDDGVAGPFPGSSPLTQNRSYQKRFVHKHEWYRWQRGVIPVYFQKTFSKKNIRIITRAMNEYHQWTCVRFKRIQYEDTFKTRDYMVIMDGIGCSSRVGRYGGVQVVVLGKECMKHHLILHQLGHVIGLFHEHTRPDRDFYVRIHEENIISRYFFNFNKMTTERVETFGLPYDYRSIMHFGALDYSKDGKSKTITTVGGIYDNVIGKARHTSIGDLNMINRLYDCNSNCGITPCPGNDYFVDKSCRCICPNPNKNKPVLPCSLLPVILPSQIPISASRAPFSKNSNMLLKVASLKLIQVTVSAVKPEVITLPTKKPVISTTKVTTSKTPAIVSPSKITTKNTKRTPKVTKPTRRTTKSTKKTTKSTKRTTNSPRKTTKSTRRTTKSTRGTTKSTRKATKPTRRTTKRVPSDKEICPQWYIGKQIVGCHDKGMMCHCWGKPYYGCVSLCPPVVYNKSKCVKRYSKHYNPSKKRDCCKRVFCRA